jgi:hypothetical protein
MSKTTLKINHDFGNGYLSKVAYEIRGRTLKVSLPTLRGGRWGNYETTGFERAYSEFLKPAIPILRADLSKRFGARKASLLIKEWTRDAYVA